MSTPKRNQKRPELIGARTLTRRSLRMAVNESQPLVRWPKGYKHRAKDAWLYDKIHGKHWESVEPMLRGVEHHVIVHQMRQVIALAKKIDPTFAAKLARAWTFKKA